MNFCQKIANHTVFRLRHVCDEARRHEQSQRRRPHTSYFLLASPQSNARSGWDIFHGHSRAYQINRRRNSAFHLSSPSIRNRGRRKGWSRGGWASLEGWSRGGWASLEGWSRGGWASLEFENFSEEVFFFLISSGKNKLHHF